MAECRIEHNHQHFNGEKREKNRIDSTRTPKNGNLNEILAHARKTHENIHKICSQSALKIISVHICYTYCKLHK